MILFIEVFLIDCAEFIEVDLDLDLDLDFRSLIIYIYIYINAYVM